MGDTRDDRPTAPAPPPEVSHEGAALALAAIRDALGAAVPLAWGAAAGAVARVLLGLVNDAYAAGVARERADARPLLAAYVAAARRSAGGTPTLAALVVALGEAGHPTLPRDAQDACRARGLPLDP